MAPSSIPLYTPLGHPPLSLKLAHRINHHPFLFCFIYFSCKVIEIRFVCGRMCAPYCLHPGQRSTC